MMTKLPSMPFFPADFFSDTAHVSGAVASTYLVLLGHAWLRSGTLPNDDEQLAFMARMRRDKWMMVKDKVMGFWQLGEDGLYRNKRLSREWSYVDEKRAVNSQNGALGGRPKSLKTNVHDKANGFVFETERKAPTPIYKDSFNSELRQEPPIVSQEQRDRCVKLARETAAAMRMRKDGKAWPSDTKK